MAVAHISRTEATAKNKDSGFDKGSDSPLRMRNIIF